LTKWNVDKMAEHLNLYLPVPYFIEYSAHFFTLKMMLKHSLPTIHGM